MNFKRTASAFLIFLLLLLPLEPALALYTGGYIPNADIKKDPLQNVSDAFASGLSTSAPELGEHGYPLGDFNVDKLTGAATYSYPFALPPGRKGLTPTLGLSYNSGNKNNFSPVGYGWELSTTYIARSDRTGVNHLYDGTNEFQLNLFGESGELVPVSLVDATHGTYGKKIEDSFHRYEFLTNGSWVVTTQDGTQYTFGSNNSTRQYDPANPSRLYKWMLEEVRDTNDNYIRFTYFTDSNQIYLSGIYYTGHGVASVLNDGPFTVDLVYENRTDSMVSYRTGFRVTTGKRLNTVTVSVDGEPSERVWELNYTAGDNTVRSLLESITMSATNVEGDDVTLEPTTFEYSSSHPDGTLDWEEQNSAYQEPIDIELVGPSGANIGNRVMDSNGDSWADLVASQTGLCTSSSCVNLAVDPTVYLNTHDSATMFNDLWTEDSSFATVNLTADERSAVLDINGDALPDFYHDNYYNFYYGDGYLINGATTWGAPLSNNFGTPSSYNCMGCDQGYRYLDVNGDGWDDKVRYTAWFWNHNNIVPGGTVEFNNGEMAWELDASWTVPVPTASYWNSSYSSPAYSNTIDSGMRFADMNGDGLPDIVKSAQYSYSNAFSLPGSIVQKVYLNNGQNGWTEEPGWAIPTNVVFTSFYLNSILQLNASTYGERCLYDANADGLTDYIQYINPAWPNSIIIGINQFNGGSSGWNVYLPTQDQPQCGATVSGSAARTVDINGDGIMDEISTGVITGSTRNVSVEDIPDLLTEVTNPAGGIVELTYTMSGKYLDSTDELFNPELPMSMPTVSQVIFDNAFGDNVITNYTYEDGRYYRYDLFRSEFAGFGTVTEITGDQVVTYMFDLGCEDGDTCSSGFYLPRTVLGDSATGALYVVDGNYRRYITQWYFFTNWGHIFDVKDIQYVASSVINALALGDPWDQWTDTYIYEVDLTNYARKGKLLERQVSHTNGNVYAQESYDWEVTDLGNGRFFPHLATEMEFLYNVPYTSTRDKAVDYTYNTTTGRVTQVKAWGQIDANPMSLTISSTMLGDERTVNTTYTINTTDWLILPDVVTLLDTNNAQVSATNYDYDSAGNLVDENHWLNTDNSWLNTHYTINAYGLATAVRNPRNITTTFAYDSENLYPASVTNALSQTTTFAYDYLSGKMANQTDPNGAISNVSYDGLGRTIEQYVPHPDTGASTLLSTTSYFDTANPRYGTTSTTVNSVTSTSRVYRDGFARGLQMWQSNEGSNNVTDFWYDGNNRLEEQTLPYSSTASSWSGRNSTAPSATYAFDVVNRVLSQTLPVGTTTTSVTSDPWITTVTDANGNQKVYHHDAYGNIVLVQEITSSGTFSTTYGYDVRNLLTSHSDPQGNLQYFIYDSLGRKIVHEEPRRTWVSVDPEWQYIYDANGNVLTVTRPNGDTTSYEYDLLDRVLNGDYFDDGTPDALFTYDTVVNGLGRLGSVSRGGILTQYDYDKQGNVTEEAQSIDSITYVAGGSYDLAGRALTADYPGPLTANYSYNALGALETVSSYWSPTPLISDFDYSPAGQKSFVSYGNLVETTNTYVAAQNYRLTNKTTVGIFDDVPDADGDGFVDSEEVAMGSDPDSIDSTVYSNNTNSFPVSFVGFQNVALGKPVTSFITEDPMYSIALGYGAANLTDGNYGSLAYPANHEYYYEIDLGAPYELQALWMKWGGFGHTTLTGPATYLTAWKLTGITTTGQEITLANQLSPESDYSLVDIDNALEDVEFTTLRIHGWSTSNWQGIFELEAYGTNPIEIEIEAEEEEPFIDTDGDILSDEFEAGYGTDPILFDTDGNGLPDSVLGVYNGLNPYPDPTLDTNLAYTGTASLTFPFFDFPPENFYMSGVEYAIDVGGPNATGWLPAMASDGAFDWPAEDYEFNTGILSVGNHTITTRVMVTVGTVTFPYQEEVDEVMIAIAAMGPGPNEASSGPEEPPAESSEPELPFEPPAVPAPDKDGDGVPDDSDLCEETVPADKDDDVDENGCALSQKDSDQDELNDYLEIMKYGTDPNNADTDGDGISDMKEIAGGTDPLNREDPKPEKTALRTTRWFDPFIAGFSPVPLTAAVPVSGNIQNLTYNYDAVGNITQIGDTSITPTAKTSTYGYDDRNFLTSVATSGFSNGDYTQTYAYDSLGNLAYKSDLGTINHNGTGFPGPHAITSIGSDNYTYDINGNLLSDGENTYTWTILNELESVTNAGGTTVYTYDGFSRKAKSVFTPVATPENPVPESQTTIYVSDLMEVRENGPVYYVNAGGERIASYTLYEGGTWRYYHNDHLSGTTLTTDEDGEVVQVLDYEPYGEQTLSLDYGTQGSPYSYTGKELDPSSGLYYYEARWYDPETGHFISTDPFPRRNPSYMIPDPARWNEYAYARGNPVAYNDPTGEWGALVARGLWTLAKTWGPRILTAVFTALDVRDVAQEVSQGDYAGAAGSAALSVANPFPNGPTKSGINAVQDATRSALKDAGVKVAKEMTYGADFAKDMVTKGGGNFDEMLKSSIPLTGEGSKSGAKFWDGTRVANSYGGGAGDWEKFTSKKNDYVHTDGRTYQMHWIQNTKTGQIEEFKPVFNN